MADNKVKWWQWLIIFAVVFGIGVLIGYKTSRNEPIYRDIVKIDTLYHIDTITQIKPIEHIVRKTDTIEVKVQVRDTIWQTITLPQEQKVYRDSNYYAVVSGFRPSLDTIQVFQRTQIVHETQVIKDKKRWGIGLQVGYGVGIANKQVIPAPYIGIGVSYDLIRW